MKKLILLALILTIFNCEKKDVTPPNNNNVEVETISAELIDNGGVVLKGRIKDVQLPLNYGFVFSNYEGGTLEYPEISEYLSGNFNGDYTITFRDNLRKDQVYYYNAVAYTSNKFIFGEEKSFVSNGSSIPNIVSVEPTKAHLLDTINIRGENFSKNPSVYFEQSQSDIIFKSDTLIKCIVPYYHKPEGEKHLASIKVKKTTEEEVIYNDFSLHTPVVYAMEPYLVHDTDTVTIRGDHFHKEAFRNLLTMSINGNYNKLEIVESSRTELKFINSGIYYDFHPKFQITSQYQTIDVSDKLELKMPAITGFPDECISFEKDFTIKGTNFPRSVLNNFLTITIGGTRFTPKEVYKDSLVMGVYDTYYKDFNLKDIVLNYFDNEVTYPAEICINEPWIIVNYNTVGLVHNYQGETYVEFKGKIAKFNSEDNKFYDVTGERIPEEVNSGHRVFNKNKLYHYSHYQSDPNTFRSYDIFTNELNTLAPFPGELRSEGFISTVGDYIYFGLGASIFAKNFDDIWRYSIQNDTWEFVINFPGITSSSQAKEKPLTFVIGNNIYFGAGQRSTANSDFWIFDTINNTITPGEPLPSPIASTWIYNAVYATSFLNKGYYYNQYLEEYDADTNSWKTYSDIPGGSPENGIFFHNGIMYKTETNKISKLNPLFFN